MYVNLHMCNVKVNDTRTCRCNVKANGLIHTQGSGFRVPNATPAKGPQEQKVADQRRLIWRSNYEATADDEKPTGPIPTNYTTIIPRAFVCEVMQAFYHQS